MIPYLKALPEPGELPTPFHWSEEFLEDFPYRPLVRAAKRQKEQWKGFFDKLQSKEAFRSIPYEVWPLTTSTRASTHWRPVMSFRTA